MRISHITSFVTIEASHELKQTAYRTEMSSLIYSEKLLLKKKYSSMSSATILHGALKMN